MCKFSQGTILFTKYYISEVFRVDDSIYDSLVLGMASYILNITIQDFHFVKGYIYLNSEQNKIWTHTNTNILI